jgi:excisionase family DNA binding protein
MQTGVKATGPDGTTKEATETVFLTVNDVAGMVGLSENRVYQLIAEGRIPHTRAGRRIRIPRAAFDRWLAEEADRALENVKREASA